MITYLLIGFAFSITFVLFFYGTSLLSFSLWGLLKTKKTEVISMYKNNKKASIDILVPSHNESIGLINAIDSLEKQDYLGNKNIYVLLNDKTDNSVLLLEKKYKTKFKNKSNTILLKNNTCLVIVFCEIASKKEKLRQILPTLTAHYTAILDADHKAQSNWISQSIAFLETKKDYECVQSSRAPLSTNNIFQLWDSAQNHIGNEMLNKILKSAQLSSFFTGTTAVFRTKTLQNLGISDCITEDTYLSYKILLSQKKIGHLSHTGSAEEVAPDLKSYVSRRRRWSNGHNKTFFDHLFSILKSNISYKQKKALLFHGIFFLIPILVVLLVNIFGIFSFLQYQAKTQISITIIAFVISVFINYIANNKIGNKKIIDTLVAFIWIFPQITLITTYVLYFLNSYEYFYLLDFPYLDTFFGSIQILLIFIPLIIFFIGTKLIPIISVSKIITLVISYPLFLFLDIYAALLGFVDFITKKFFWDNIARTHVSDYQKHDPKYKKIVKKTFFVLIVGGLLFFISDTFFTKNNCGKPNTVSGINITKFFSQKNEWNDFFTIESLTAEKKIKVIFTGEIQIKNNEQNLIINIDGKEKNIPLLSIPNTKFSTNSSLKTYKHEWVFPMGFEQKKAVIKSATCQREYTFPTTAKQIIGDQLFINAEPFLVKGLIPSFNKAQVNLSVKDGLAQIKKIGANLVRTYHTPGTDFLETAFSKNLFVYPQANKSNWDHPKLDSLLGEKKLSNNYHQLQKDFYKHPLVFMASLGNEIELRNSSFVKKIFELLETAKQQQIRNFISYSTYLTFINYPVDIISLNMLDTGDTYWKKAMDVIKSHKKPLIATELGGFTAFHETPNEYLRAFRLIQQWQTLIRNNAVGGIIFQSHDNWAQPIPGSVNDPFSPEQPDDLRGIWNRENNPKIVAHVVKDIFKDIIVTFNLNDSGDSKNLIMILQNKRKYRLDNISLVSEKKLLLPIFSLNPQEVKKINILNALKNTEIAAHYTTHQGFSVSQNIAVPINKKPYINSLFALETNDGNDRIEKTILNSTVEGFLPKEWNLIAPEKISKTGMFKIENTSPLLSPISLENLSTKQNEVMLKFKFSSPIKANDLLIIDGVGSNKISFSNSQSRVPSFINTHQYRENIISLNDYVPVGFNDYFFIKINRNNTVYITAADAPNRNSVIIDLGKPKLFSPQKLIFEKKK